MSRHRADPGPPPSRGARREPSPVVTTVALALVLLAVTAVALGGSWQTREAAVRQQTGLSTARTLQTVQYQVSVETLYVRQFRLEPSLAVRQRFTAAADAAEQALEALANGDDTTVHQDARTMMEQQRAYRTSVDRLVQAVQDGDPRAAQIDASDVVPDYYTLQRDVDRVTERYRSQAERQSAAMREQLTRTLATTAVGLGIGLGLLGGIYRSVLGYQRSLVVAARDNERLALHDALTGLPNRVQMARDLERLVARTDTEPGLCVAALVVDLDGFKGVNDSLGHQAGDALLAEVGTRLAALVRAGDTVARTGGDEFVVLLGSARSVDDAEAVARRVLAEVRRPVDLAGTEVRVGASIGVALTPQHCAPTALVETADAAMYHAKRNHLGVVVFDPLADRADPVASGLLHDLTHVVGTADPDGQLELHYQPQVELAGCVVSGVEALLRWRHPERGLLPPSVVFPLLERTGLEADVTAVVVERAVQQAAVWLREGTPLRVAVNVSPAVLVRPGFVDDVRGYLADHGVPGDLLQVELVESAEVAELQRCADAVTFLRTAGVSVSLDDFGTGYSSLSLLQALTVDEIKIDREFVAAFTATGDDLVLRMAASLGRELGVRVVAEGVEQGGGPPPPAPLGCTAVQGFGLARPVPAGEVVQRSGEAARAVDGVRGTPRPEPAGAAPRR